MALSIDDSVDSVAERLCNACGICCNGVLFHLVRLQSSDSISELAGLGLKIKRKKGNDQFSQPCPAYQDCRCAIYSQRPTRCRRFECRQLQGALAGEISEVEAQEKIKEVLQEVREIERLMGLVGTTDESRPLSKRFEKLMAEPLEGIVEELRSSREELERRMEGLQLVLDRYFRVENAELKID